MAKRPVPGSTKTRLTPHLSAEAAADLYECLLRDTILMLDRRTDCDVIIAIDGAASAGYFAELAPGHAQVLQRGTTLGPRLDAVLSGCLDLGYGAAFAIGSDSPDLPDSHVAAAFVELDRADVDVVFGPTDDGGYYLIGWKQRWAPLVTGVTMSTSSVLTETLAIARSVGASVALAPSWYDVDVPGDLARLGASIDAERVPHTAEFLARRDHLAGGS